MNYSQDLTDLITDDCYFISVKVNLTEDQVTSGDLPSSIFSMRAYLLDWKVDILYSTAGIHLNGENKVPHMHYSIVARNVPQKTFLTENARHRNNWLAKDNNHENYNFTNLTVKLTTKRKDPVWQCLCYPWKENLPVKHGAVHLIPHIYEEFLLKYAVDLYQVSLGNHARKDACDARKKVALESLGELCVKNREYFSTYRDMLLWLDTNYIDTLTIDEYPDPRNYKTNCQKIAVSLKILKYSEIS